MLEPLPKPDARSASPVSFKIVDQAKSEVENPRRDAVTIP